MNDDPLDKVQRMFNDQDSRRQLTEFEQLCKKNHSNLSRELKFFMLRSVKQNRLN